MVLKALGLLAPFVAGTLYLSGALAGGWSRDVARTPAQVAAAIADLDIRKQPGSPGTDPSRSGGVAPVFRVERAPDKVSWTVMSRDRVAIRMTALLEPLDGGRHTRVTAEVERGDAPDDLVSPAFRSTGITLALFSSALEEEIDRYLTPAYADAAHCEKLMQQFAFENGIAGFGLRPDDIGEAVGNTARIAIRLKAMETELRRNGCDTRSRGFQPISDEMSKGGMGRTPNVSFEPGKPMVDVSRPRNR
jgi:hypothetical protein